MDNNQIEQAATIAKTEASKLARRAVPKINNPEQLGNAQEQLRELTRLKANINAQRLEITRPHRLVITRTDELFNEPIAQLAVAKRSLEQVITAYQTAFKAGSD